MYFCFLSSLFDIVALIQCVCVCVRYAVKQVCRLTRVVVVDN